MIEITVPVLGESITEATVAKWLKKEGDEIRVDEPLVELETDKVTLEVNATTAGVLSEIKVPEGREVEVGALIGLITEGAVSDTKPAPVTSEAPAKPEEKAQTTETKHGPAATKLLADNKLDPVQLSATGKDGRLTKGDVLSHLQTPAPAPTPEPKRDVTDREERVRMTRLRQRVAERLKSAQNTAAILSTFNEVDMTNLLALRRSYKESFEKKHGVKLGFMSFFLKAAVQALKDFPAVNAEIEGTDIVYKNYYDIGVAVGTPQGLVVPVVRDVDQLSFAEIEQAIFAYAVKAREGKIAVDDLTGGTFTISNGGVFGSLLSTPILNPPQSGILGMHKTQERPVAINGKVEIRPMMYLALSYDHRIIDGSEAVSFLVRLKDAIEDPQRLLLNV